MKKVLCNLFAIFAVLSLHGQATGKVSDIDGNRYTTISIGKQEWMAENLKTTRLNDGSRIPEVSDDLEWYSKTSMAYSWYENSENKYKNTCGALYNGYAVETGKLCPKGWHVPDDKEWLVLFDHFGGTRMPGTDIQMNGELKSTRTEPEEQPRWDSPNTGATNKSGFTALPCGNRNFVGYYHGMGKLAFWWTAAQGIYTYNYGWYSGMRYDNSDVFMTNGKMKNGYSVRCVRD